MGVLTLLSDPAAYKAKIDGFIKAKTDADEAVKQARAAKARLDQQQAQINKSLEDLRAAQAQHDATVEEARTLASMKNDQLTALAKAKDEIDLVHSSLYRREQAIAQREQAVSAKLSILNKDRADLDAERAAFEKRHAKLKAALT